MAEPPLKFPLIPDPRQRRQGLLRSFFVGRAVCLQVALVVGCTGCSHAGDSTSIAAAVAAEDREASLPQNREVEAKLEQHIAFARFDSMPLEKALQQWSLAADVTLIINWPVLKKAGVLPNTPVTVTLHNVRLSKALQLILKNVAAVDYENRLGSQIDDGRLLITTNRELKKMLVVRKYDISDLLAGFSDSTDSATQRTNGITPLATREEAIRQYLTDHVDSLSWEDNVDIVSWRQNDGTTKCLLMISQTPLTQQKIRSLLLALHQS